jgi:hypothetical protein
MRRNRAKGNPDFRHGLGVTCLRITGVRIARVGVGCVCVSKAGVTKQCGNLAQHTLIGTATIRRQGDEPAKQQ